MGRLREGSVPAALVLVFAAVVLALSAWLVLRPPGAPVETDAEPPALSSSRSAEPTSTPTATPAAAPTPPPLSTVAKLLRQERPVAVSILGDLTGDDSYEWVRLWAEQAAETRAVTYFLWDDTTGSWLPPEVLSSDGPELTIWNLSAPDQEPEDPAGFLGEAQPERPDVVIYNFGHTSTAGDIGPALGTTNEAVEGRWGGPITSALMLQNPSTTSQAGLQDDLLRALPDVAAGLGFAVIDATSAFRGADRPLGRLLVDGTQPNSAGGRLWADAVVDQLS